MSNKSKDLLTWAICASIGLGIEMIPAFRDNSYSNTPDNVQKEIPSTSIQNYIEQNQEYLIQLIEKEKRGEQKVQIVYQDRNNQPSRIDIEVKYDYIQITDKYGVRAKVPLIK